MALVSYYFGVDASNIYEHVSSTVSEPFLFGSGCVNVCEHASSAMTKPESPAENPLNAVWLKTSATKLTCTYCRNGVGGKVTGSESWWQCCKYIWASCVIIAFSREGRTKIPAC